ncbi:LysM peptidoglycan-binding domain-containing protein [Metallumcola ferriviriculae]|uniref:LysM peptidoglycan-binding domain-containing protein n=1 Tax=Metallumcola ferriviriculae TaxID=3039180 RepID=A0AAU0UTL8_9FIRM|nr:LysM peptidoglycan-binding domain-containing protein [Desulfitibacteraceae bacterium MK1]
MVEYIFQKRDTLDKIASDFGVSKDAILRASNLKGQEHYLIPGLVLRIPASGS